jgi:sialate O-acetylesterase
MADNLLQAIMELIYMIISYNGNFMKVSKKILLLAILLQSMTSNVFASILDELRVPDIFSDNMVIQAKQPVSIWGHAGAGDSVTIVTSWIHKKITTQADKTGYWQLNIVAPQDKGPHMMTIGGVKNKITIKNILCGQVWLCAGQSNMQMKMRYVSKNDRGVLNYKKEIARANYPEIRYFLVSRRKNTPSNKLRNNISGKWMICTPDNAGDFSGVAYFFGETLYKNLKCPVGLIDNSWGGTMIQAWMSPRALQSDPDFKEYIDWTNGKIKTLPKDMKTYKERLAVWKKVKKGKKPARPYWYPGKNHRSVQSVQYNSRVFPLRKLSFAGAIWYQGEGNGDMGWLYERLLPAMIKDWRSLLKRQELPFLIVQLPWLSTPGHKSRTYQRNDWSELRDAQFKTCRNDANAFLTVGIDAGDYHIHPRNKRPIGERLAYSALSNIYNKDMVGSGPIFKSVKFDQNKAIISFESEKNRLKAKGGNIIKGFVMAGENKKFYPAIARIKEDKIELECDEVRNPVAVRYAWAFYPDCNLYNEDDFPAVPFRSDNFRGVSYGKKSRKKK